MLGQHESGRQAALSDGQVALHQSEPIASFTAEFLGDQPVKGSIFSENRPNFVGPGVADISRPIGFCQSVSQVFEIRSSEHGGITRFDLVDISHFNSVRIIPFS